MRNTSSADVALWGCEAMYTSPAARTERRTDDAGLGPTALASGPIESNDDAGMGPTALSSGTIESNEETELPEREGTVIAVIEAMEELSRRFELRENPHTKSVHHPRQKTIH